MSDDIEAFERQRLALFTAAEATEGFARLARTGFAITDIRMSVGGGPPGPPTAVSAGDDFGDLFDVLDTLPVEDVRALVERIRTRFGLD